VLWTDEHRQYAMWALGNGKDIPAIERPREPRVLLVRANPIDRASRLVEELCGAGQAQVADGALLVALDTLRAGEINYKLVSSGITVSELRPVERLREEAFPELASREEV
jgi:hypothetical protein